MAFLDCRHHGFDLYNFWGPSTPDSVFVLDISIAYFIVDTIMDCFNGMDVLFLLHHVCSSTTPFLACHVTMRGAPWLIKALFIGEITNPLQVPWLASKQLGYRSLHDALSGAFTFAFVFVR